MNQSLMTYLLLISTCLNISANSSNKALEHLINKSQPYLLEKLLENCDKVISNDAQLQIYLNLANKIADLKRQALNQPEIVQPGAEYKSNSFRLFTLASLYGIWFILTIWNEEIAAKYHIGFAYGFFEISAFLGSYFLWIKGDKEFKQSAWRTRQQEYLDAFIVKQIFHNLSRQHKATVSN